MWWLSKKPDTVMETLWMVDSTQVLCVEQT